MSDNNSETSAPVNSAPTNNTPCVTRQCGENSTCNMPGGFVCDAANPTYQTYSGVITAETVLAACSFATTQINYMKCADEYYSKHFCPNTYKGPDGPPCFMWKNNNNADTGTWNVERLGGNYTPCCLTNKTPNGEGKIVAYPWESWERWANPGECFIANEESCMWNSEYPLSCADGDCYTTPVAGTPITSPNGDVEPNTPVTTSPDGFLSNTTNANSIYTEWWVGWNFGGGMANSTGDGQQCWGAQSPVETNDGGGYACACSDDQPCTGNATCNEKGICEATKVTNYYAENALTQDMTPGRCVLGNYMLRAFCEEPVYRQKMIGAGTDPPGFDFTKKDTAPFIYNVRNGQCYMSMDYCHQINEYTSDELKAEKAGFQQCEEQYGWTGDLSTAVCNQPWSWNVSSSTYWQNVDKGCENTEDPEDIIFGNNNTCGKWKGIGKNKAFKYACVHQKSINSINTKAIDKSKINKKGKMMCLDNKTQCELPYWEKGDTPISFITSMTIGPVMFDIITGQCGSAQDWFNKAASAGQAISTASQQAAEGVAEMDEVATSVVTSSSGTSSSSTTETYKVEYYNTDSIDEVKNINKVKNNNKNDNKVTNDFKLKNLTTGEILDPFNTIKKIVEKNIKDTDEVIFNIDPRCIKLKKPLNFTVGKLQIFEVIEWRDNTKHTKEYTVNYRQFAKEFSDFIVIKNNIKYAKITKKQVSEASNKELEKIFAFMSFTDLFSSIMKFKINDANKSKLVYNTLNNDGISILNDFRKNDMEIIKKFIKEQYKNNINK